MLSEYIRRPHSLALRLTVFIGVATTMVFLAFGWFIERSIQEHFAEQDATELGAVITAIQQTLRTKPHEESPAQLNERLTQAVMGHHGVFFYIADSDGQKLYATPGPKLSNAVDTVQPSPKFDANSLLTWQDQQQTYRIAVIHIPTEQEGKAFTLAVATAMDFHLHYMSDFRSSLWVAALIASIAVILVARLATYQGHAPLRRISSQIQNMSSEHLHVRLAPAAVPIELVGLANSFNTMIERIEDVFRRQSNFSADIAHEMRTPVTNLITQSQIALNKARSVEEYREVLYSGLEEYERMAKMINDMLFLAQADNNLLTPEWVEIDMSLEIETLFEYFEAWAEERKVSLQCLGKMPVIRGDRLMLRRAMSNLLSNAIRYTNAGQAVTVELGADSNNAFINIENPGKEIPREYLPRLFDRFYRVDTSRQRKGEGAGIGLAIVKSIVEAHGGNISVISEKQRTKFLIVIPNNSSKI